VDPRGKFVYVTNADIAAGSVLGYTIEKATGALTPIAGSPFASGFNPLSVAVDPTGKFAYVANTNSNSVSGYTN
jgi:6-phosphogluconolactonase